MLIATVTAYGLTDGLPLDSLTPSIASSRRNADGTWTALAARTGVWSGVAGSGIYEWSYSDIEAPAGTLVRWVADFGGSPQVTTSRLYDGELDGSGVGQQSGLQAQQGGTNQLGVMPGETRMKVGDREPSQFVLFSEADGSALDLTGSTVSLTTADRSGTKKVNAGACTVLDPSGGLVSYPWGATESDTAATYSATFKVTFPDGKVQTVPSRGYALVLVQPAL